MTFTTFNDSQLGAFYSGPSNILDNAGFEIWQRGTSFSNPANNAYTADRWFMFADSTPTYTVTRESSIIDSGLYSAKVNITALGGNLNIQFRQLVENYQAYLGKTITLSMRVWASMAGVAIRVDDGLTSAISSAHTGNSTYQTLSVTFTPSVSGTRILIAAGFVSASTVTGTMYFDSAMLVVGSQAATFIALNPAEDLMRCLRYYQAVTFGPTQIPIAAITGVRTEINQTVNFLTPMRVAPSVNITMTQTTQLQSPPNTPATLVDSPTLWPFSAINTNTQTFSMQSDRNPAGGTYPFLIISGSWTASADL